MEVSKMTTYKLLKSTYGIKGKSKIAESDNLEKLVDMFFEIFQDITTRALIIVDNSGSVIIYKNNESGKEEILPN